MSKRALLTILLPLVCGWQAAADEVRYFEKDGITYRETKQVVRQPVTETRLESRENTVYREQLTTDMRETQRNYATPVTEYQWVPYMERGWNLFNPPHLTYRLVPQTRWETRTETVRFPVTRRDYVPEKRTVQVPVTTQRLAENVIISQIAVGARPAGLSPSGAAPVAANPDPFAKPLSPEVARRDQVGGVSKLESDPPRASSSTTGSSNSDWRAADPGVRR